MQTTKYLVIGGGMTAAAACKGIRDHDADGAITLVASEPHSPYKRPPLSKGLWSGGDEGKIWIDLDGLGVDVHLGRRIESVDVAARRATDDEGEEYEYEKVLLATGGKPRELAAPGADVVYFRTLDDYHALRQQAQDGASFVVIGGGFIGSEIAAALTNNGAKVTMVFPEPAICWRLLPGPLASFVTDYYREKGVDVRAGALVSAVEPGRVTLESGEGLVAESLVAGLGILPQTELAERAGLTVENGIVVDAYGRVGGRDDVFAAGDVANFPSQALGLGVRIEHEDHANTHGRVVGANMAGAGQQYDHLPFFYSDMFDLGYEAVGQLDSRLATVERWQEPNRKGVVAFVDDERRPQGVLLWDTWGKVDAARQLIRSGEPVDEESLAL